MADLLDTRDGAYVKPVTFWMVWNKDGAAPRVTHASEACAQREAIRLAKVNPGQKFIVLAATEKFWLTGPPADPTEATAADLQRAIVRNVTERAA
jgi:hypothetical protein